MTRLLNRCTGVNGFFISEPQPGLWHFTRCYLRVLTESRQLALILTPYCCSTWAKSFYTKYFLLCWRYIWTLGGYVPSYVIVLFVSKHGMISLGYNCLHIPHLTYVLYKLACLISELTHARIVAMFLPEYIADLSLNTHLSYHRSSVYWL